MDPREKLSELARERGNSLAALSRMLGRNSTYLQQYITKGSPRKLEERLAHAVARLAAGARGAGAERQVRGRQVNKHGFPPGKCS